MARLSNQARRHPHIFLGRNPHEKPLMPESEYQALQNRKPAKPKKLLSGAELKRINKYIKHIRECQRKGHRPRSVPKSVLELIVAHKLWY
jgi:hypothetical protein